MKNHYLLLLFIFFSCLIHSQDILWEKSMGGKQADYLMDAIPTPDYGFILAGSSLSKKSGNKTENSQGNLDYWVWKMNEKGDIEWQKCIGGTGSDFLNSIALTRDAGFILAGTSSSPGPLKGEKQSTDEYGNKKDACRGQDDFWIIKLNAKGEEMWQKTIGGSDQEKLNSIAQTPDGGYILGGSSASAPILEKKEDLKKIKSNDFEDKESQIGEKTEVCYGNMDYWLVKLDKKGEIEWQKTFGGIYEDELRSIQQTTDGGYILGGYSNSPISGNKTGDNKGIGDYWILKVDDKGNIQWQKTIGGDQDDQLYIVHQTFEGNFIIGGSSNSGSTGEKTKTNQSGTDFWILQLNPKGDILWQETYDFGKEDILTSLVENNDHTFLIGGYAQGETSAGLIKGVAIAKVKFKKGTADFIAMKINEKGEELWSKTVGSDGEDILKKVVETRDGGYLMAGTSNLTTNPQTRGNEKGSRDRNSSIGGVDFWVVKLKDKKKPLEIKVSVEAIPNPTESFTNIIIGYEFEKGTATVVDMMGRILQQFAITTRTVPVDLSRYPSGVYIVNIKTNVQSDGVKVIKGGNN